jgi:hypothetical protein
MSMFTKLTDTNMVPIFSELVLLMALVAVLIPPTWVCGSRGRVLLQ